MTNRNPILTFESCGRVFGCDLLWIGEILRCPPVMPVDCPSESVRGHIRLRGQKLTVLDLEVRIGLTAANLPPTERCIVFRTADELARLVSVPDNVGEAVSDRLGILVDKIGETIPSGTEIRCPAPGTLVGIDPACISGVVALRDSYAMVLKIGMLLACGKP